MAKSTRRSFICTTALAGAGASLPRWGRAFPAASRTQGTKVYDVAILGAGMSGMAAGRDLIRAGLDVVILEARQRVGGRMETLMDHSAHGLETGTQMIHGSRADHWELVREFGIETRPFTSGWGSELEWDPAAGFTKPDRERAQKLLDRVFDEYHAYRGEDISYKAFLDQIGLSEEEQSLVGGSTDDGEPDEKGLWGAMEDFMGWGVHFDQNYQVVGGNQLIAEKLAATLGDTIQLSSLVKAIEWKRGAVKLTYEREGRTESVQARRAIVTLPTGVLQTGKPSFSPALPAWKRRSIDALPLGDVTVVHLWFKDKFWMEKGVTGWTARGGRISYHDPHPEAVIEPVLSGWITGLASRELGKLGEKDGLQRAIDWVQEPFPGINVRERLEWSHFRDWGTDPYTLGSYSFVGPGGYGQRAVYATPIEETLYFAGESSYAPLELTTVHSAYVSGRRAAREILSSQDMKLLT